MSKFLFSIQKGASEVADFKKENLSIQNLQHWKKNFCCGGGGLVVDAVASRESDPRFSSGYFQLFSSAVMICLT